MCWNKEVSIATFVIAIIGSIYLYYRNNTNDRWIAIFGITIAMIQLAEFFMWSDLSCGNINKYASIFALLILAIEPFMFMICGIYFSNTSNKHLLKYMLIAYIIFIGYLYFTQVHGKNITWCGTSLCGGPSNNKVCNLRWLFLENINHKLGIIWIMFLMIQFLTMTPKYQGIILFVLGFIALAMASKSNSAAFGSLWCWFGIGIIFTKIIIK